MQAMPVLEALLNKTPVRAYPYPTDSANPDQPREISPKDIETLAEAFLVRSDEAADIYWNDTQNRLDPLKDFGPLRLPGEGVWIEYKDPDRGYADGQWGDLPRNTWGATYMYEKPLGDGQYRVHAWQYVYTEGGDVVAHINSGEGLDVDRAGYAVGEDLYVLMPDFIPPAYAKRLRRQIGDDALAQMAHPCRIGFIAVGLMNCKNVTTTETDKGGPRRRKSRGRKNPRMTYRTINIPGRSASGESDGTPAEKAEYALHRVRGHFKTYTAERPLMGQHVGTYWWGWQARGKVKNGISTTDYKVGTGA